MSAQSTTPQHPPIAVNVAGIPDDLKNLHRWVVWRAQPQKNGKFGKIPTDPSSGRNLNWRDPGTWMTFDDALAAYQQGGFGGIGIVLSDEHPVKVEGKDYYLIALDYDAAAPFIDEAKEDWLSLGKPYIEVSPSGKGLHMFARCTKRLKGGNNGNGREMYSSGRFMTVTGHGAKGTIKEATASLIVMEQKWFSREASTPAISMMPTALAAAIPETDDQVRRVREALTFLTPDSTYEHWRNIVWAILSTGWDRAVEIAREWSKSVEQIEGRTHRYEEQSFQTVVGSFDPNRGIKLGTLFHHAKEAGWVPPQTPSTAQVVPFHPISPFAPLRGLLTPDQVKALPVAPYRVRGLLPRHGVAAIYGEAGSGKSFLVIDLIFAIAAGHYEWFGIKVKQAPVVYVGLEGRSGISKRIKGWEAQNDVAAPQSARFWLDNLTLLDPDQVDQLSRKIVAELGFGCVTVIDTLNQAAPGADENNSADMGRILSNAKRLAHKTQGLVILIHHLGKDKAKGLRGHSSLIAALDAAIEVVNGAAGKSWRVTKSKDDENGIERDFDLRTHIVDHDEDGLEVTSCAISKAIRLPTARVAPPKGKNQIACMDVLKQICREQPSGLDERAAIDAVAAVLDCARGRRKTVARDTIQMLAERGNLRKFEGVISLHE